MSDSFVQQIINRLFNKGRGVDDLSGKLSRSEGFEERYALWKTHGLQTDLQRISESYNERSRLGAYRADLHIFESDKANGFYFNRNIGFDEEVFEFLLDFFRDVLIADGYALYTSDTKYKEVPAGLNQINRHYLKPAQERGADLPLNQKFGNVLLELVHLNGEPQYLKCMVSFYSDRNYLPALPFSAFMEVLLGAKK